MTAERWSGGQQLESLYSAKIANTIIENDIKIKKAK